MLKSGNTEITSPNLMAAPLIDNIQLEVLWKITPFFHISHYVLESRGKPLVNLMHCLFKIIASLFNMLNIFRMASVHGDTSCDVQNDFQWGTISCTLSKNIPDVAIMANCEWQQANIIEDSAFKTNITRPGPSTSNHTMLECKEPRSIQAIGDANYKVLEKRTGRTNSIPKMLS